MYLKHGGVWMVTRNTKLTKDEVNNIWIKNSEKLTEYIDDFPKNLIYMRWNYFSPWANGNLKTIDWYKENNMKVMGATAGQTRWILMPQDNSNIEAIKSFSLTSVDKKLDGLLLTLWDDDSPHFELYKRGIAGFSEYSWAGDNLSIDQFKSLYRYRNFGYLFKSDEFEFIDHLEKPVSLWLNMFLSKDGWRPGLSKKENPLDTDIIDLPDLNNKGEWSKNNSNRINNAIESLKISSEVENIIARIQSKNPKNKYTLEIYQQVNELTKFSANLILKLEKVDKSGDLSYLDGIENQFTQMRNEFERVYSKTRVINKSEDYILDQDHHHHPANQTINFDWQFLGEIMILNKIKKTYNYEKI
jgi:hypothetical protein